MYSDIAFKKALVIAREYRLRHLTPEEPHVFSAQFEKKMQKLVRSERRVFYPLVNSKGRRLGVAFAVAIILSMTMVMSVSAFRIGLFKMVEQLFDRFSIITYQAGAPLEDTVKPFVEYELTDLPEGFVLTEECSNEFLEQLNLHYQKDNQYIVFDQSPIETADFIVNTEGITLEEITIDGMDVHYYSNLGVQGVFWNNGEYVFSIVSELDNETLLNLVKHTKIREK